ncbi:radical SAM protein [bacterium]|nr:radical SAM protein [bacterium]
MKYLERIKNYTLTQAINAFLTLLGRNPEKNIMRLAYLTERITKRRHYLVWIRKIRRLYRMGHPSLEITKRIINFSHPHHRKRIIRAFVINHMLKGSNERKRFSEMNGFYPPSFFAVSPTMRCNLHCHGCYAGNYPKEEELDAEAIDRAIRELNQMGSYYVVVIGGEPFIREDLFDIFARHPETAFMVYTNGTMIDEAFAKRLLRVGNVLTILSLEGFREETDARRGEGVFDKVMEAMDILKRNRVLFGFSVTHTRKNADVVTSEKFIDILVEKGCILGWYFSYVPIGRHPHMELMATTQQRKELLEKINYYRGTKPILLASFFNEGQIVGGCMAAGKKYFHINAQGDVEPCVFCHFAVDNIKDKTLREVLNSSYFKAFRSRMPFGENLLSRMPFGENLLRPCPLHDHPWVMREVVKEAKAQPTSEGAEHVVTNLAQPLDDYAREWKRVADPIWEKEYKRKAEAKKRRSA